MFQGTFHVIDHVYKEEMRALGKASDLLQKEGVQKIRVYRVGGGYKVYYLRARLSGKFGDVHEGTRVKRFPLGKPVLSLGR